MNFGEALDFLKKGFKVRRKDWGGYWFIGNCKIHEPVKHDHNIPVIAIKYQESIIFAKLKDGGYAPAQPYQADLLTEDWQVENSLHGGWLD